MKQAVHLNHKIALHWDKQYNSSLKKNSLFNIYESLSSFIKNLQYAESFAFGPPRDKTNNVAVHPAKTQISLGICPVSSESSLCA